MSHIKRNEKIVKLLEDFYECHNMRTNTINNIVDYFLQNGMIETKDEEFLSIFYSKSPMHKGAIFAAKRSKNIHDKIKYLILAHNMGSREGTYLCGVNYILNEEIHNKEIAENYFDLYVSKKKGSLYIVGKFLFENNIHDMAFKYLFRYLKTGIEQYYKSCLNLLADLNYTEQLDNLDKLVRILMNYNNSAKVYTLMKICAKNEYVEHLKKNHKIIGFFFSFKQDPKLEKEKNTMRYLNKLVKKDILQCEMESGNSEDLESKLYYRGDIIDYIRNNIEKIGEKVGKYKFKTKKKNRIRIKNKKPINKWNYNTNCKNRRNQEIKKYRQDETINMKIVEEFRELNEEISRQEELREKEYGDIFAKQLDFIPIE